MQKNDAQLSLIAENLTKGVYATVAELETAMNSVAAAKRNSLKAFAVMAKSAKQGKAGIVAMATEAFDGTVTAIKQVETKATLMFDVIQAELDEMEENMVTDDIEDMDFEEGTEASAEASESSEASEVEATDAAAGAEAGDGTVDFDDNGIGDKLSEEQIKPTDNTAADAEASDLIADDSSLDFDDNGSGEKLSEEEIKPTDNAASQEASASDELEEEISEVNIPDEEFGETVIESMDDADGIPELFEEKDPNSGQEEPIEANDVKDAMRATASANGGRKNANTLEACWDFNS